MKKQKIKDLVLSSFDSLSTVRGIVAKIEEEGISKDELIVQIKNSVDEDLQLLEIVFEHHSTVIDILQERRQEEENEEVKFEDITKLSGILSLCRKFNFDWLQIKEFIDRVKEQERQNEYQLFQHVIENQEEVQKTIDEYFDFSSFLL